MSTATMRKDVAGKLRLLSNLSSLAGENKFKARAYQRAASTVEELPSINLETISSGEVDGIGEKIACKIREIAETGTCPKLEELRRDYSQYLELLSIPGIGPAKAKQLYDERKVQTVAEVQALIESGVSFPKQVKEGVAAMVGKGDGRTPLAKAEKIVEPFLAKLRRIAAVMDVKACGSYRRKKETIGDLDIAIAVTDENAETVMAVCEKLMDRVETSGSTKSSGRVKGIKADFRLVEPESFGACTLYFTGSKQFNISMRSKAKRMGMKLNEYGLFKMMGGEEVKVAGETEELIFKLLHMDYVEPTNRN